MAAATLMSFSPPFLSYSSISNHRISSNSVKSPPPLKLVAPQFHPLFLSTRNFNFSPPQPPSAAAPVNKKRWKLSALRGDLFLLETTPVEETAQEIVSATKDDGVSTIISGLLFVAFIGLSILTIGVIYIAVTDFLQKREKDKFEKEEAAKQKKSKGKKIRTRARAGPRGFGQKVEDEEIDELPD
ncbi:OLC1v1006057C1 [Oldenlandia corymbosa var. corymbosa]|uniref:OLC1v1006057C1 n=1 Tax=Oldenlandia corymbosa var. corymbosa TaxID=529605 RepID=A0AAV1DIS0_OLDCO|nr:OLC1v1006057C1 [Oldenlandia corymbosa var. corymbosa]